MDGYIEARKIQDAIDDLLTKDHPSIENWKEWANFNRTLRTGLKLIEQALKSIRKDGQKRRSTD